MKGMVLSVIQGEPGRIHLALYEKHTADKVGAVLRHELTIADLHRVHEAVTDALWHHVREGKALKAELDKVSAQVLKACQPQLCPHGCGAPYQEVPEGSHSVCPNCRQTVASCCGDI
jgi:hypothetical protein